MRIPALLAVAVSVPLLLAGCSGTDSVSPPTTNSAGLISVPTTTPTGPAAPQDEPSSSSTSEPNTASTPSTSGSTAAARSIAELALAEDGLTIPWQDSIPKAPPGVPGLTAEGVPSFPPAPKEARAVQKVLYIEGLLNLLSSSFTMDGATTEDEVQALYDAAWKAAAASGLKLRGVVDPQTEANGIDPTRPGPMEFVEALDPQNVIYCYVALSVWSESELSPAQQALLDASLPGYRAIMGPCAPHADLYYS